MTSAPHQATCVAIGGRAVLIEGSPGSGKSSLALALIDRGAILVGDDGVVLHHDGTVLRASPAPAIAGKIEVRNLGLFDFPTVANARIHLVVSLDAAAERWIEAPECCERGAVTLPFIRLWPGSPNLALKVELALARYGAT